jgi:hypothetical protein
VTRWVSTLNDANASQQAIALVTLAQINFLSGTLYLNDGFGNLLWGGNTYLGLGDYGQIDAIQESTEVVAKTLVMTLSGVSPSLVTSAMTENYQGRVVSLFAGLLDVNALSWIDNPELAWEGRMDFMNISIAQNAATITMSCESRLNRESLVSRYTDTDQQIAFPGDTFFNLMWQIPLSSATWGNVNVQHPVNILPTRYPGASTVARPLPFKA